MRGAARKFYVVCAVIFFGALCFEGKAFALITLDSTTSYSGSGSSLTQAHTVAADANGMVVTVRFWDCVNGTYSVSSMSFNGDPLALANRDTQDDGSCGSHTEIWYLAAPDIGTYNLVINFSASTGGFAGSIVSLKGFKQTNQPDAVADSADHTWCSNPDSTNITVASANAWIFDAAKAGAGTFGSPSAGQTQLNSTTSYKTNVSVGSNSMGWAFTGCNSGSHALAAFAPDTGGGNTYSVTEGRFTGGGGSASSTNYQLGESSFENFESLPMTSTSYNVETKVGVGGQGIASIISVSPADFSKLYSDQSATYTVTAVSQDGDTLQYKAKQDSTVKAGPQSSGALNWSLSGADQGRHTISLEVIDPNGTTLKKQEAYVVRRPTK